MDSNLSNPLVSIIMPVYNSELYIEEAINSTLAQTYTHWELICIDDASSDQSVSLIRSYTDPRIRLITLSQNGGVASARNHGLREAKGAFIAFLDSDDIAHPSRLTKQVNYLLRHPKVDGIFSRIRLVDVYGNPHGRWSDDERFVEPQEILHILPYRNCLAQSTAMLRAEVFLSFHYHTVYRDSEDWGLWLELISAGHSLHKINEALVDYRLRPTSETTKSNKSPIQKLIRFRSTYLQLALKKQTKDPLIGILRRQRNSEQLRYWYETSLLRPLRIIKKIIRANPPALLLELIRLNLFLRKHSSKHYFFFPYHHVGGAEKVHLSIVHETREKAIVFFTKKSDAEGYKKEFEEKAHCIDIWKLCWYPFFKTSAARMILHHLSKQSGAMGFCANSQFFYEMLASPTAKMPHITYGDLVHAFVHPEERGSEHWSLPVVSLLKFRVVIGEHTKIQFADHYAKNKIDKECLNRILLIHNYIQPGHPQQPNDRSIPELAYIGRATPEKRVELIGQIAEALQENFPGLKVHVIGDVARGMSHNYHKHMVFHGVLDNEHEVYEKLQLADFLLLTSQREGMPMAILEAMTCGAIPISCAVGNIPYIIHHGENGWLLPSHDAGAIVDKAREIISSCWKDKAKMSRIRTNMREETDKQFNFERFHHDWQLLLYPHSDV
jgi:L-malate glycosyltransferase